MKSTSSSRNIPRSGQVLMDFFEKLNTDEEIFLYHIRNVSDVVRSTAPPVTLESTMKEIWTRMNLLGVSDLPVVDAADGPRGDTSAPIYVGIVRKRNLAAMASRFVGALSQHDSDDQIMQIRLSTCDAIDRSVGTAKPNTSIFDAIETMVEHNSDTIAVVGDDGRYHDSFCILDVLSCMKHMSKLQKIRVVQHTQEVRLVDLFNKKSGAMPSDKMLETFMGTARDVMDESFVSIVASATIGEAMSMMERAKRHSLIVVDDNGNLKGITTSTEIQLALPPIAKRAGRVVHGQAGLIFKTSPEESAESRQARAERVVSVTATGLEKAAPDKPIADLVTALMKPTALVVPILDSGGVIKGVVERWDLAKAFLALGGVVKKQGLF